MIDYNEAHRLLCLLTGTINKCDEATSRLRNIFVNEEAGLGELAELRKTVERLHEEALEINAQAEELLNGATNAP